MRLEDDAQRKEVAGRRGGGHRWWSGGGLPGCGGREAGGEGVGVKIGERNPEYGLRTDTDCILQNVLQRPLELLQYDLLLQIEDAQPAEEPAGDSLAQI